MDERRTWHGVVIPAPATLEKYGWTLAEWKRTLKGQGYVCGVCARVPASGRLVTDHEHVPGWKFMDPEVRKTYIRGLCCNSCNHWILGRFLTAVKARGAAEYLDRYAERRANADRT